MLEKNKDYIEMRVSSTDCAFTQNAATTISIEGFSYDTSFRFPDLGESYVIVSKEKFEKLQESMVYYMALSTRAQYWKDKCEQLQADNEHYREMAKQWESNYGLLLEKTGFTSVEDLIDYICDPSMTSPEDKTLKEIIDECEKDYISERDKAEALQTENEQLKKKLQVPDPFAEYKELLEKLHSKEDVEKFEWTLNHICGGQASVNGWMVTAKLWRRNYETLSKLVGFSSVEEIQDYLTNEAECDTLREAIASLEYSVKFARDERRDLSKKLEECEKDYISARDKAEALQTENEQLKKKLSEFDFMGWMESAKLWKGRYNDLSKLVGFSSEQEIEDYLVNEAECDTLHEAISKLKDQVKYTCDEWYSANSRNNSWKAAAECNSPKEFIEKREALEKENRKLTEEVDSWKNTTGYSTPEDYMHARINCATPFDYTAAWQTATGCDTPDNAKSRIEGLENAVRLTNRNMIKEIESNIDEWRKATGCSTPEQAKERIKALNERIDESEADYNHLLCTTGFESEGEIEDALDKCDHSTLRKALVDYEFDYENLLKLTGYKSEHDIRVALNYSEQFVYETLRELINSLKRKAKFTESGWQVATGRTDPEAAKQYIDRLKGQLNKIHGYSVDW